MVQHSHLNRITHLATNLMGLKGAMSGSKDHFAPRPDHGPPWEVLAHLASGRFCSSGPHNISPTVNALEAVVVGTVAFQSEPSNGAPKL